MMLLILCMAAAAACSVQHRLQGWHPQQQQQEGLRVGVQVCMVRLVFLSMAAAGSSSSSSSLGVLHRMLTAQHWQQLVSHSSSSSSS
jgi:hypothetical protein